MISAKADSSPSCACRARSKSKACSSPLASCGPHRFDGVDGLSNNSNPPTPWGRRLLFVGLAHSTASCFELRSRLFQLGFLLSSQNGKHLLMQLVSLSHQLCFERRDFR